MAEVRRLAAGILGLFALANLGVSWAVPGFDLNRWWIDVAPLPGWFGWLLTSGGALALLAWAVAPSMSPRRKRLTQAAVHSLMAASVWDVAAFYGLLVLQVIDSGFPVPMALFVLLFLAWLCIGLCKTPKAGKLGVRALLAAVGLAGVLVGALPLAQMLCFGKTDYRRPADVAVVFGAAVWPGNVPSQALRDRVLTGVELYKQGLVKALVMSGGPSDEPTLEHETTVMRALALQAGVPDEAIWLDPAGVNTQATAVSTAKLFRERGVGRILAVSHFYHLPRIQMAYLRGGVKVYTVPAKEERILFKLPYYMAREIAAIWWYYVREVW